MLEKIPQNREIKGMEALALSVHPIHTSIQYLP